MTSIIIRYILNFLLYTCAAVTTSTRPLSRDLVVNCNRKCISLLRDLFWMWAWTYTGKKGRDNRETAHTQIRPSSFSVRFFPLIFCFFILTVSDLCVAGLSRRILRLLFWKKINPNIFFSQFELLFYFFCCFEIFYG